MKRILLAVALAVTAASSAEAQVLNFEGVNGSYPSGFATVNGFYNGGTSSDGTSGVNHGITFSSNAQAICLNTLTVSCSNTSRGGLGDPNSQRGGLFFLSGNSTYMSRASGFQNGFSFFYSAVYQPGSFTVWSGMDGTGTPLATLNLGLTSGSCPGYSAGFCPFVAAGVSFAGTAQSVTFAGAANQIVFDDVTFGSSTAGQISTVPEPGSVALLAAGMVGMVGVIRRRKQQA